MSDYRLPKSRELARIAWRQRVDEAAREFGASKSRIHRLASEVDATYAYGEACTVAAKIDAALAAPKPWRKPWRPADIGRSPCWLAWGAPPWHCPDHSPRLSRAQRKRRIAQ